MTPKNRIILRDDPRGAYELTINNNQTGLLLPAGHNANVANIAARWNELSQISTAIADAYLEGVYDGIRYEVSGR